MLKISRQQLAAHLEVRRRDFEEKLAAKLIEAFPEPCAALGVSGMQCLVQKGISRAAHHQIHSERDVGRFIGLMLVMGETFDVAPPHSGMADILALDGRVPVSAKLEQLWEATAEPSLGSEIAAPFCNLTPVGGAITPCPNRNRRYWFSV